jgi:hypothetical protein
MKRITLAVLPLLCCMGAAVQSQNGSSANTNSPRHRSNTTSSTSDRTGKKMIAVGCISERDGKFMLTNSAHPEGIELSSSENLRAHVGHKVQISGIVDKGVATSGSWNQGGTTTQSDATTVNQDGTTRRNDSTTRSDSTYTNQTSTATPSDGMKRDGAMNQDTTIRQDTGNSSATANGTTGSVPNPNGTASSTNSTTGQYVATNQHGTQSNGQYSSRNGRLAGGSDSMMVVRVSSMKMVSETCSMEKSSK